MLAQCTVCLAAFLFNLLNLDVNLVEGFAYRRDHVRDSLLARLKITFGLALKPLETRLGELKER